MILTDPYLDLIARLNEHYFVHARNTLPLQLLKVQEELGEASAAYIGWQGLNPRKGNTHTHDELVMELADVVLTSVLALYMATGSHPGTDKALHRQAQKTLNRLNEFEQKLSEASGT